MEQTKISEVILSRLRKRDGTTRIAVVGASNDPSKYGNIIVRNLSGKGFMVLPVNPKEKEIAGLQAYPTVQNIEGKVDLVVFVTPPQVSMKVLEGIDSNVIDAVWFQDGSFDENVIEEAKKRFTYVVHNACVMMVTNWAS